jgi:uncharacterized repeat protein (TIGR01451 family)
VIDKGAIRNSMSLATSNVAQSSLENKMKRAAPYLSLRLFAYFIALSVVLVMVIVPGMTVSSSSLLADKAVTVRAAGRGNPLIRLQDGQDLPVSYSGQQDLVEALRPGGAKSLSLASGDFNEDGTQDLVSGFAGASGGILTLTLGNRDAISASTAAAQSKAAKGDVAPPFLSNGSVYSLPVSPDFLAIGDFGTDGHKDVIAAARGGQALYLLKGDGKGDFAPAEPLALPGRITAMAGGDYSPAGASMVVVGITGANGPQLVAYRGGESATYSLGDVASSLAIEHLSDGTLIDVAAGAGRQVLIIPSAALTLAGGSDLQEAVQHVALPSSVRAVVSGNFIPGGGRSLAALLEDGHVHLITRGTQAATNSQGIAPGTSAGWEDVGSVRVTPPVSAATASQPVLSAGHLSNRATDDLFVSTGANGDLQILMSQWNPETKSAGMQVIASLDVQSGPVAVLATRLNNQARPGLVILRQGQVCPTVVMPAAQGQRQAASSDFAGQSAASFTPAVAASNIYYNSIPSPLPPNVVSLGFQATQTAEFGELIQFAAPANRALTQVTVVMSDWALASDWPSFDTGPTWNQPITLILYNVNNTGPNPAPGTVIATRTSTFAIPWRPAADPAVCGDMAHGGNPADWLAPDGNCYSGLAFVITFDFSGVVVPGQIIYGVAYNTETWGANPIGTPGPYESLNLGLNTVPPTVGSNPFPDTAYWNTETPGNYTDGGAAGVGIFRRDTDWTPYNSAVTFNVATAPTITKTFSPTVVPVPSTATLTFTIANPNPSVALTGVAFTDTFPSGTVVASPASPTDTCGGTLTASPGAGSLSFSGGTVAAGGSCKITVAVRVTTPGIKNNVTSPVTSTNGGTGSASNTATLGAFDICLKDNTTGDFIEWSSTTGDYLFTHCGTNGFTLTGTGSVALVSGVRTLKDTKSDRNITASFNTGSLTGTANVVVISGKGMSTTYRINDTVPHQTCSCGS